VLALNNIEVVYDGVILVLRGVSLVAEEGHITTLLGANGAGKTTTLKAISGLLHAERGEVTKGNVELDGVRLDRLLPHDVVRRGIVQDRKSTRLNSSHLGISYAVFCLKKKKRQQTDKKLSIALHIEFIDRHLTP